MPAINNPKNKILFVDDVPSNISVLFQYLTENGLKVFIAEDGESAIQKAIDVEPNLILLDIMMPGIDGFETCRRLKDDENTRDIPVIFMTAITDTREKVKGFNLGAVDYVTKPLQHEEVLARIQTHLTIRNLQRELEENNQLLQMEISMRQEVEREFQKVYNMFVPTEFLKLLGKTIIVDLKAGECIEKEMTILFSDIRDFTSISEGMTPEENFAFINSYLKQMEPIIHNHKGFIDKFIGDAVMALFESAEDAVEAAIEMQNTLREYNINQAKENKPNVRIGIGINTGLMMLGTVGGENRIDGTVISDAVNVASRLEGKTKVFKSGILIAENTLEKLDAKKNHLTRRLEQAPVKGKSKVTTIYEVYDCDPPEIIALKKKTAPDFTKGVESYEKGELDASREAFSRVLAAHPQDTAAMIYMQLCI